MYKSTMFRFLMTAMIISSILLAIPKTALAAWVNLSSGHACAPTQGHFVWSQSNSTNDVAWYQYEKWTGSQYTCIHGTGVNWYHVESEAYNPGAGTSCDKLHTYSTSYTLPASGSPAIANGCGSSTYKEETKFYIQNSGIVSGTQYWTRTNDYKYNAAAGNYEVNWSFSNVTTDWWMAKIGYKITLGAPYATYTPYCSNPTSILVSTGC